MSVSAEKNGTYTVQVWFRDNFGNRKKKTKRGFAKRKDADAWEKRFKAAHEGSIDVTFEDFYGMYAADVRPRLKANTWATKSAMIESKILPFFGWMTVSEITPRDVLMWQNWLREQTTPQGKGLSQTYLRTICNQLAAMINHAVRFYGLPSNPICAVGKIGSEKTATEMQIWTPDEYAAFAKETEAKPILHLAFDLLFWTGIRLGELLALKPNDIDLARGTLRVDESYQRLNGKDVLTAPKTVKSVRTIWLPESLTADLEDHLAWSELGDDERIFASLSKGKLHTELARGAKLAGLKKIRVHDFRHSHASVLFQLGYSVIAVSERLGHEASEVTYRYAHLLPHLQLDIAASLDAERNRHDRKI